MDIDRITAIARSNKYFSSMTPQAFDELQKLKQATIGFPIGLRAILPVGNRIARWQWAVASPRHTNHRVRPETPKDLVEQWTGSQRVGGVTTEIYGIFCGVVFFGVPGCRVEVVFCNESRFNEMRFATHILQEKFFMASGNYDEVEAAREACKGFYLK